MIRIADHVIPQPSTRVSSTFTPGIGIDRKLITPDGNLGEYTAASNTIGKSSYTHEDHGTDNAYVVSGGMTYGIENELGTEIFSDTVDAGEFSDTGYPLPAPGLFMTYRFSEDTVWRCGTCACHEFGYVVENSLFVGARRINIEAGKIAFIWFLDAVTDVRNGSFTLFADETTEVDMTSGWAWMMYRDAS